LCNKGFTIIEILVTLTILAFGIIALTKMQVLSIKGTGFNKESTAATALAQQVMEDHKAISFGTKPTNCGQTDDDGMKVSCSARITGNAPYRCNDVTVTVAWGVPEKQISLSTTIAEK
jgi:prepilin-type N-terminal cleavage/methylation domain-containing protein